jgi:hypothetical protein
MEDDVKRCLAYLKRFIAKDQVTELRAFGDKIYLGFFDGEHLEEMARCAVDLQMNCRGVYFIPNPINPELLERSKNKVTIAKSGMGTTDADILKREWLLVDVDPVRPADSNASEDERNAAWNVALSVYGSMDDSDVCGPIMGFSGNGWHLCYPIDMPNDEGSRTTCQSILYGLNQRYGNDKAKVDVKTFNASRIWKLYGTVARKGESTDERPHRSSFLVPYSDSLCVLRPDDDIKAHRDENTKSCASLISLWKAQDEARAKVERDYQAVDKVRRAIAYLDKIPPAISGQNGHSATYHVACILIEGFDLTHDEALEAIKVWNGRCVPPWTEKELVHKFKDAAKNATNRGHLLNQSQPQSSGVQPELPPVAEAQDDDEPDATAADIKASNMTTRWAWKGWIQLGATTCLAAEPGVGKTRFSMDLARRIYHALPWPDGEPATFEPGTKTLWIPADGQYAEMSDVPEQMGIPLEAVVMNARKSNPFTGTNLDKPEQLRDLERRIMRVKPALVFIDTVGMVTDKATYRPEDAKQVFKPFAEIAQRTGVGMVLVTHLSKGGEALGRRIVGATRQVIKLCKPETAEESRRRLWVDKTSTLKPPALGVTMKEACNEYDQNPPELLGDGSAGGNNGATGNMMPKATSWLKEMLESGPKPISQLVKDAAANHRLPSKVLFDALDNMGAERYTDENDKRWVRLSE